MIQPFKIVLNLTIFRNEWNSNLNIEEKNIYYCFNTSQKNLHHCSTNFMPNKTFSFFIIFL